MIYWKILLTNIELKYIYTFHSQFRSQSSTTISFTTENFTLQNTLVIPVESASFEKQLSAKDSNRRMLLINVKVVCQQPGCSRKVGGPCLKILDFLSNMIKKNEILV